MRRKLLVLAVGCAVFMGVSIAGWNAWRRHSLDRRVDQALSQLEQGSNSWISEELLAAIQDDPRYESQLRLFRGAWLLRSGEPESVFQALGNLRAEGRLRIPLLLVAGEAFYKLGRLSEAEGAFRQIEASAPHNSRAHRWLANIYHDLGNMHACFAQLEKVAALEPDDFFAFRLMGTLNLLDFQRAKEAAECFRQALARNPPAAHLQPIRTELAQALMALNDYAGALEAVDQADSTALVLAIRAECRWGLGEKDRAVDIVRQALVKDPNERAALLLNARIALEDGNAESAVAPLQTLLDRDPHDVTTRYQLSLAYQRLGDKQAAAAEIEKMNASKALREQLGKLYAEAIQRTRDPDVREEIAGLCEKLNQHELAEVWRRSAAHCRQNGGATRVPRY